MFPAEPASTSVDASALHPHAPLRRSLVGVDGSDAAAAACAFALWLAGKADVATTLVHVSPGLAGAAHAGVSADAEALNAAAERRLRETRDWHGRLADLRSYAALHATVDTVVRRGAPAPVLIDEAVARRADVILVGSSGIGMLRGTFLGSVSSKVVEHAPCSVMVIRASHPAAPARIRSVVVGVDGSAPSLHTVAVGEQLARALDARLVLATSWDANVALAPPTRELRVELRRNAAEVLRAARLGIGSDLEVIEELGEGVRPRDLLVATCRRHGPAIVVVGSRGRGALTAGLLGSTSRWLVNHATSPVLVVRGDRREEANGTRIGRIGPRAAADGALSKRA
jgi:nucleotide-binding universal stress UspA family protein